ncbi:hypothetical protein EVAR_101781_1 [Eumeta japonica]|uniref:Uncharacterized protein n=1 Tax=Eumeta variegata TaxID=151549 RepID=A0A4C1SQ05_EUMVA|nr:hypothetical protein EVAR_101781_1 [Eumeta japonica]
MKIIKDAQNTHSPTPPAFNKTDLRDDAGPSGAVITQHAVRSRPWVISRLSAEEYQHLGPRGRVAHAEKFDRTARSAPSRPLLPPLLSEFGDIFF